MGKILDYPYPVLSDPPPDLTYFDSHEPLTREEAKELFSQFLPAVPVLTPNTSETSPSPSLTSLSTLPGGTSVTTVQVRPFAGELIPFPTPDTDPERDGIIFQIKRCGVRENTIRQNLSSTIRFVSRDDSGDLVQERDYPVGDLMIATVKLALADWNLVDSNNIPLKIDEETIQQYLTPAEYQGIYDKILEVNPMWGRGENTTKKS